MIRFLVSTVINSIALWVVVALVPGISFVPYGGNDFWPTVCSYLLVAAIFGLVNAIIAPVIKVLAIPLYILTFGLISVVINGALLLLVAWLSQQIPAGKSGFSIDGFTATGLTIDSLGWALLGALVMSVASFIGRWIFRAAGILY